MNKYFYKLFAGACLAIFSTAFLSSYILVDEMGAIDERRMSHDLLRASLTELAKTQNERTVEKSSLLNRALMSGQVSAEILKSEGAIATGLLKAHGTTPGSWTLDSFVTRDNELESSFIKNQINQLDFSTLQQGDTLWLKVAGENQQVYFLQAFLVQQGSSQKSNRMVSFTLWPTTIFSSFNTLSKNQSIQFFIADRSGVAFAYPEQQYVGASVSYHPVVTQLKDSKLLEQTQTFETAEKKSFLGGYTQILGSNLYVVSQEDFASHTAKTWQYMMRLLFVCLSVASFVFLILLFVSLREQNKIEILEKNLAAAKQLVGSERSQTKINYETPSTPAEPTEIVRGLLSVISHPLNLTLGLMQSLENEIPASFRSKTQRVLIELRKIADVNNQLQSLTSERSEPEELIALTNLVNQVVATFKSQLSHIQLSFSENWNADSHIKGQYNITKSILNYILNFISGEVSSDSSQRELSIQIEKSGGLVFVKFAVLGRLLSFEEEKNFFQPRKYFLSNSRVLGMDLMLARAHAVQALGDLTCETIANGFVISLQFPNADQHKIETERIDRPAELGL